MVSTNIWKVKEWPSKLQILWTLFFPVRYFGFRNPEQGSRTSIYCAVAPIGEYQDEWGGEFVPGAFHHNLKPTKTIDKSGHSTSTEEMQRLYKFSAYLLVSWFEVPRFLKFALLEGFCWIMSFLVHSQVLSGCTGFG